MCSTMKPEMARAAAAAFFLALAGLPPEASAQSSCWPRSLLAADLAARWREVPVGRGLTGAGLLVELFASSDGSSWTLVATRSDGRACPLAVGLDWHRPAPPSRPGEGRSEEEGP